MTTNVTQAKVKLDNKLSGNFEFKAGVNQVNCFISSSLSSSMI
jgi:hypothetical protein